AVCSSPSTIFDRLSSRLFSVPIPLSFPVVASRHLHQEFERRSKSERLPLRFRSSSASPASSTVQLSSPLFAAAVEASLRFLPSVFSNSSRRLYLHAGHQPTRANCPDPRLLLFFSLAKPPVEPS
ncbi:hypothetical protein Csa_023706, partial [Cucumis sativus]